MSSNGEMKMSLKLMICPTSKSARIDGRVGVAHILMPKVLEQLQLAVCAL